MEQNGNDHTNEAEAQIEGLKKQADEYLAGWKRAKADLMNMQNVMDRERTELAQFAAARCIERLLPVVDSLHAALDHAPDNEWAKGIQGAIRKLDDYLKNEGVSPIEAEGLYDPALHEVVAREKKEKAEHGVILRVVQRGYLLHGRVLRTSKVIVAE